MKIERVAVIGAGTMGNGIAHVCALSGLAVSLVDSNAAALERALATIDRNSPGGGSRPGIATAPWR